MLKFGLETSGNGTLQVLATTCHAADTCRHRFFKHLCRIRGHLSMTNKIDKEDKENGLVCLDHTKASCCMLRYLQFLPSITDISVCRTGHQITSTNSVGVCGGGVEGLVVVTTSHNNTTNVTAKVNWNQRPQEHHEGWMVGG